MGPETSLSWASQNPSCIVVPMAFDCMDIVLWLPPLLDWELLKHSEYVWCIDIYMDAGIY